MDIIEVKQVASKGIAFGKCFIVKKPDLTPDSLKIDESQIPVEKEKMKKAISLAKEEISVLAEKSEIFKAHLEVADDPALIDAIYNKIEKEIKNAQIALEEATLDICAMFEAIDDEYLRERAVDIKDVSKRMMSHLKGVKLNVFDNIDEEVIVVAEDLTPSDTANMNFDFIKGFVTALGGVTSHVAIIARQLEVPAMVGITEILSKVENSEDIIIDAINKKIIVTPDSDTTTEYKKKAEEYAKKREELKSMNDLPAETKDGHKVHLFSNIGNADDVDIAIKNGSEGVGLFRTELLYMESNHFPTEDEQFEEYKKAIEKNKTPMIVRTLDIGGDKSLPYYEFEFEENPFLGFRAVRICLELKEEVFKPQLKALLRASHYGDIRIMYPMIISVDEFLAANSVLEECKEELRKANIPFNEKIETGIMIETPAAVLMSSELAKVVDFFSIGTNDLTQYILCVDRGNTKISGLYNSFNPAVLNAIKMVIDNAHKYDKMVGVCGEFASDERAIPILLGLGLDEFSMASSAIVDARYQIRNLDFEKCKEYALNICKQATVESVEKILEENNL